MLRRLCIGLILCYRAVSGALHLLSQTFGVPMGCKYPETCSQFSLRQFREQHSLRTALTQSLKRLLSCHPWSSLHRGF